MSEGRWTNPRFDYSGAHVLVTGGTSGIGAATAAAYRDAGAIVTITGRRKTASEYDVDLTGYRYLPMDIEDNASMVALATAHPRLDILVNNAGIALPSVGLDEYEPDVFTRAVNMLLVSAYRMAKGCAAAISKSALAGGGSIINIGSMASFFGIGIVPGYGAAKTGIVGLTRVLAVEWAKRNIRVNTVAAGLVKTGMTAGTFANSAWTEPALARTPIGRLGTPDDISGPILFLTSAAAAWITGQTLVVDGGYTVSG